MEGERIEGRRERGIERGRKGGTEGGREGRRERSSWRNKPVATTDHNNY